MWLRDVLPDDLKPVRIMTYGYRSELEGSKSFQVLEDIASTFRLVLMTLRRPRNRPIVFIAHSLGGLVLKEVS